MRLTTPLPGNGGSIVKNEAVRDSVLDTRMVNGGYIILPTPVLSWADRVEIFGDDEPQIIDPTKYDAKRVKISVPYMPCMGLLRDLVVLDPIYYKADNLLRSMETMDPVIIQRSVVKLQDEIYARLTGKDGLLSRNVYSVRCSWSSMFVVVSGPNLEMDQIGIPDEVMTSLEIADDDVVIVVRSPVLWQGSVLALHAYGVPGSAGQLNPWCLKDLGADFDGDHVSVFKASTEIPTEMIGPVSPSLPLEVEMHDAWASLTIAPGDEIDGEFAASYRTRKDLPPDAEMYARGLTLPEFEPAATTRLLAVGGMKLRLGLIGSITDKLCHIVPPEVLPAAMHVKEKLTQSMLDTKHGTQAVSVEDLSNIVEHGSPRTLYDVLLQSEVVPEDAQALTIALGDPDAPIGLSARFRAKCPDISLVKSIPARNEALQTFRALMVGRLLGEAVCS